MIRILAGALALVLLLLAPDGTARAASGPLVTGKCWCAIGWGRFMADCGSARMTCTKPMCAAACLARLPAKTSAGPMTDISATRRVRHQTRHDVDGIDRRFGTRVWDAEAPRRPGHDFREMWSQAAQVDRDGRILVVADAPRRAAAPRRHVSRRAYASRTPVANTARSLAAAALDGAFTAGRAVVTLGASLAGLPAELVAKVAEIAQACPGFRAISTYRPGAVVAGTHVASLHGFHRAADIAGPNYGCAYAHLAGWPGGVSTDPERVHHIHLSYNPGGREWGARFRHGGGQHYARHGHRHRA